MTDRRGEFCLSLSVATLEEARRTVATLPPAVGWVELRLDLWDPRAVAEGGWTSLAGSEGRRWIFTWRSPAEGGARPRPAGVLQAAGEAGFDRIDVEAVDLDRGDPEATAVPVDRRWVSRHRESPPERKEILLEEWTRLRAHPAALHKYVVPAADFTTNLWMLELLEGAVTPCVVFAVGWPGHLSRILGYFRGNAVTYLAAEPGRATAAGQPTVRDALDLYRLPRFAAEPRIYGVLGDAARHSRSPELHNRCFQKAGLEALYLPLETADPEPVREWLETGRLAGASVTTPFKEVAGGWVLPGDHVATSGSINTLWMEGGRLRGANTDFEAARDLLDHASRGVAILGAGGAARGMVAAARARGWGVHLFARDPVRGPAVAAATGAIWGGTLTDFDPSRFDWVINATPLGREEPLPEAWIGADWSGTSILDLAYGEEPTAWERLARNRDRPFHGGLEFLCRQAIGQQERWTGRRSDPGDLFRALEVA